VNDHVNFQSKRSIKPGTHETSQPVHYLRIENESDYPFTTGPVFVQDEKMRPLAQDEIKYTAIGSRAWVEIAPAIDVNVDYQEEEIKKQERVKKHGNYYMDLVTIKGTMTIRNYLPEQIRIQIQKSLNGNAVSCSDEGDITKTGTYNNLHGRSTIDWELDIPKTRDKIIEYKYQVYVRHY
jgi:hypothetical protein